MDDPRFSAMHTLPTFKKIRKEKYETQVDDRFAEMHTAEKFSLGPGEKKKRKTQKEKHRVLQDDVEVEEENDKQEVSVARKSKQPAPAGKAPERKESRLEYLNRLARGEVDASSSSEDSDSDDGDVSDSSDSSSSDDEESVDGRNPLQIEKEEEVGEIEEATSRLAIQNCEWNNVRAEDLMVILQSFCAPGMQVKSVAVYPSDFGLERMREEAIHGPPKELWKQDNNGEGSSDEGSDDEVVVKTNKKITFEEEEFNNVALRAYELSKLRYYFAIAVFDSSRTAEALYTQLDGVEFEHSAMVFDMRFVPDDVSFSDRNPRDQCKGNPSSSYKPPDFVVKALTHSNVECTWDMEEDSNRKRHLTNVSSWRQLHESDLQQYLAESNSDDSDENNEDEEKLNNRKGMRKLLLGDSDNESGSGDDFFKSDEEEEDMPEMTFSFVPGEKEDLKAQEMKKRMESGLETPQEAAARRKEARKALKKQKDVLSDDIVGNDGKKNGKGLEGSINFEPATADQLRAVMGHESDNSRDDDYDMHALTKAEKMRMKKADRMSKKKNRKSENEDINDESTAGFAVNTTDDRFFPALRNSSNFGIDPTATEFKPTEGMNLILQEQRRLRRLEEETEEENLKKRGIAVDDIDNAQRKKSKVDDVAPLVDRLKKKYKSKK